MGAITHQGEVLQGLPANASQINFDKTGTNLNSTQTEAAIKEVNAKVNDNADEIDQLKSGLTSLNTYIYGPENKSNLDFNTLKEKYSCRIGNLATCTNIPNSASTGVSGVLVIEPHGSTIIQKFYGNLGESHRLSFDTGTTWESWV